MDRYLLRRSLVGFLAATVIIACLAPATVWSAKRKRPHIVFFTTLGHPKDFEDDTFRRLLINGIFWALGLDVPQGGANVEVRSGLWGWEAPDTH